MEVRAVLDTGSQQSYATQRVQDALALESHGKRTLSVMTFGSRNQNTQACDMVRLGVVTQDGEDQVLELFTIPFVCQPLTAQQVDLCTSKYHHLSDLDLADSSLDGAPMEVNLLIGSDCYWRLVTGEVRRGEAGPVAIHTWLGWALSGVAPMPRQSLTSHSFLTTHALRIDVSSNPIESLLKSYGICKQEISPCDKFFRTVTFQDGRYQVSLPWKEYHGTLEDNYLLSLRRLRGLLRRLRNDPRILEEYDWTIRDQLARGIVEPVPLDKGTPSRVHYLPHHCVVHTDKSTTKLRIVYIRCLLQDVRTILE